MSIRDDVIVKSMVKAVVVMNVPTLNIKRTWLKKGAIQRIPKEILEQAIYDPGVEYLFKTGILYIDDMQTKIDLGLEEPETTEPTNVIVLDNEAAKKLLTATPLKEYRETINKLSHEQLVELANTAVELEVTDYQRLNLLKQKTDIDVFKVVLANKEDKEKEEAEKNKA